MNDPVILDVWQDWECPRCPVTQRTRPLPPNGARFHNCAGLHGLNVPLVRAGSDCTMDALPRDDYVGSELVQTAPDNGRPYMAVTTRYSDGRNDLVVFAPTARATLRS